MSGYNWNSNTADYVVYPTYVSLMHPSRTRAFGAPGMEDHTETLVLMASQWRYLLLVPIIPRVVQIPMQIGVAGMSMNETLMI